MTNYAQNIQRAEKSTINQADIQVTDCGRSSVL